MLKESNIFAHHVMSATQAYLRSISMPEYGTLFDFDFDIDDGIYTIKHKFMYKDQEYQNFYIIPLDKLWEQQY